jgi:hypothetical protein
MLQAFTVSVEIKLSLRDREDSTVIAVEYIL